MSELINDLTALAYAGIYVEDLARGVEGEFEITGGWCDRQTNKEAVEELHLCQTYLVRNGWRRDKEQERLAPYSHNIEVACYRKQFLPGQQSRWVTLTLATRFGVTAKFKGVPSWMSLPW